MEHFCCAQAHGEAGCQVARSLLLAACSRPASMAACGCWVPRVVDAVSVPVNAIHRTVIQLPMLWMPAPAHEGIPSSCTGDVFTTGPHRFIGLPGNMWCTLPGPAPQPAAGVHQHVGQGHQGCLVAVEQATLRGRTEHVTSCAVVV